MTSTPNSAVQDRPRRRARRHAQPVAKLATQLRPEERALFDVYLMMLDDASLGSEVTVIKTGQWAQGAAPGGLRARQPFRTDGRRLPARARLGRADLGRRLLAYLQEARSQSGLPRQHHPGQ
jgi:phosphotransferase system enzyme I (PtsP)